MKRPRHSAGSTLVLERLLPAPPERVWRAWTDPAELARWFSPSPDVPIDSAEIDPRVGGLFRIVLRTGPRPSIIHGTCLEVTPPLRLVMSWTWEPPHEFEGIDTRLTIDLRGVDRGTEITLRHEGLPSSTARRKHSAGHRGVLDNLARSLLIHHPTPLGDSHEDR